MSYAINPVQVPDFNATMDRAQAARQNALAMQMQQREWQQAQAFDNALAQNAPGLVGTGAQQRDALGNLLRSGTQGARFVLPMLQKQQEDAQMREAMAGIFGPQGGAPQQQAAPQAPAMPQPGGAPSEDPRQRNAQFAALRQQAMEDPNLSPQQREAALARISAAAAGASGLPQAPGGYRAAPGFDGAFNGLPAPSGVVPGAAPAGPQSPLTLPQPGGSRAPTLQQISAMMTSGNERLMKIGKDLLPLVQQANPNMSFQTIGGQVYAINPQNPTQRIPMGPAEDVQEASRTVQGQQVPGQTINGRFHAYPRQIPEGYTEAPGGGVAPLPNGPHDPARTPQGYTRPAPDAPVQPVPGGPESFSRSNQLRDEATKAVEPFRVVQSAFTALNRVAANPSPASDLALLYQFNKLLDPGSVVRESEFANAARTGSLDQRIGATVLNVLQGVRLTPEQRADFVKQAQELLGASRQSYDQVRDDFTGRAQRAGVDPRDVLPNFALPQTQAPSDGLPSRGAPGGRPPLSSFVR